MVGYVEPPTLFNGSSQPQLSLNRRKPHTQPPINLPPYTFPMGKQYLHLSVSQVLRPRHYEDPVRDLNNLLQRYKVGNGNLSQCLSWVVEQTGPDHQKTLYATANRESVSNA